MSWAEWYLIFGLRHSEAEFYCISKPNFNKMSCKTRNFGNFKFWLWFHKSLMQGWYALIILDYHLIKSAWLVVIGIIAPILYIWYFLPGWLENWAMLPKTLFFRHWSGVFFLLPHAFNISFIKTIWREQTFIAERGGILAERVEHISNSWYRP